MYGQGYVQLSVQLQAELKVLQVHSSFTSSSCQPCVTHPCVMHSRALHAPMCQALQVLQVLQVHTSSCQPTLQVHSVRATPCHTARVRYPVFSASVFCSAFKLPSDNALPSIHFTGCISHSAFHSYPLYPLFGSHHSWDCFCLGVLKWELFVIFLFLKDKPWSRFTLFQKRGVSNFSSQFAKPLVFDRFENCLLDRFVLAGVYLSPI